MRIIRLPLRISSLWCLVGGMLVHDLGTAHADWQLGWSDEFSGTNVDTTKWTFDIGNGSGGWGNNEKEYYTSRPQNVCVTNGILHIIANKESYGGQNYTSAKSNGNSVANFHIYTLEWANNAIRWYVDGQLYETQTYWWSSSNITGPWDDVTGATSPCVVSPAGPQEFYRIKLQE